MKGTITLYDKGAFKRNRVYNSPAHRQEIIDTWRKLYGKLFARMSWVDQPDIPTDKIKASNWQQKEKTQSGISPVVVKGGRKM